MQLLDDFIKQQIKKPFELSKTDCVGTVNDWLKLNRGEGFLERFEINYSTFAEKDTILESEVNFLKAILKYARLNNEVRTKEPKKGDVAAIVIPPDKIGLAIHCGNIWFTRNTNGIIGIPVSTTKVIKAWKLNKNG